MNLLMDEHPLMVMPKLATLIGLNEAIILQQLNYWLKTSKHVRDGYTWIYNTFDEWSEQFPFWSVKTIKRAFGSLESRGLVVSNSTYNKVGIDRTKWYRIDYELLEKMALESPLGQIVPTIGSNCPVHRVILSPPSGHIVPTNNQRLHRDYTETTKDIDFIAEINNFNERYSESILEVLEKYFEMIKQTRTTGKIADSVVHKIMETFSKYDVEIVHYAMLAHLNGKEGAKEQYTFGILRRAKLEEAKSGIERFSKPLKPKKDEVKKKFDFMDGW